jgi:hypothetical protein
MVRFERLFEVQLTIKYSATGISPAEVRLEAGFIPQIGLKSSNDVLNHNHEKQDRGVIAGLVE